MLVGLCCIGCNGNAVFKKTIDFPGGSWDYANPANFEFDIADTTKTYRIALEVEHAGDYRYQNLYVQIRTKLADGEVKSQLVSLELAAQSGIWNGECSGNTCVLEIPIQPKAKFKTPGHYAISVEQYMRENPMHGVRSLGLKIDELQP